jgi:glutathione S-transferase
MRLYFAPGSCALSPHIVLIEAGLAYTLEQVDLRTKKTASGADYLSVNPKGYVPALDTGSGAVLTEGPAIVQYLGDLVPGKQLVPAAGTMERYHVIEWLNFISAELHKSYSPFFRQGLSDDVRAFARANLERRMSYLNEVLARQPYLMDQQFTVADAYLYTVLNWNAKIKFEMDSLPHLQAYFQRMGERPAVQQARREQGLD